MHDYAHEHSRHDHHSHNHDDHRHSSAGRDPHENSAVSVVQLTPSFARFGLVLRLAFAAAVAAVIWALISLVTS
jgi:hypothetical protein